MENVGILNMVACSMSEDSISFLFTAKWF